MKEYSLTGWKDYWEIFDELTDLLTAKNKTEVVIELTDAKKYVNGLTDGWYEFKFAFEKAIDSNNHIMTKEQTQIGEFLITFLNKSLRNG